MAKGKRSNSPKRSRRGGRRSPKKNKGVNVQKKITKGETEPSQLHDNADAGVEEPDCACELTYEEEVPSADFSIVKEELVQFFWNSLEEDAHASMKLLSELPEQHFIFGKVASELVKTGKSSAEVESKLAVVWKADEAWIRSLLAGEIELPKPEEPEQPEEQPVELEQPAEPAEAETAIMEEVEMADVDTEEKPEVEVATEVVEPVEVSTEETAGAEPVAMDDVVDNTVILADEPIENAVNKENTADVIADAVKTISSKLGEQSVESAAPVEGLAPKDLNVVQPMEFA